MTPSTTDHAGLPPRLDSSCHQVPRREIDASYDPNRTITTRYVARPVNCDSWFCQRCGYRKGQRVLARMIEELSEWDHYGMLTLTVDRDQFEGPEEALTSVTSRRCIGKLMARLRDAMKKQGETLGRYIIVLEFQAKSGEGWPHWHLLVEMSCERLPKAVLREAWRTWRDGFEVGGLDFQIDKVGKTPARAARYACKYLLKGVVPPPWILTWATTKPIKLLQGSRPCPARGQPGVRPLVGERYTGTKAVAKPKSNEPKRSVLECYRPTRTKRTNEDRLVSCKLKLRTSVQTLYDGELVEDVIHEVVPGTLEDLADEVGNWALEPVDETACHKLDPEVWRMICDPDSELSIALKEKAVECEEKRRIVQRTRWGRVQSRKNQPRRAAMPAHSEAWTSPGTTVAQT